MQIIYLYTLQVLKNYMKNLFLLKFAYQAHLDLIMKKLM